MLTVAAAGLLWPGLAGAATSPGYSVRPAPYAASARFAVTYAGSGSWSTVYHSEPPDPGGVHDTNDAHDSSQQAWSLRFLGRLALTTCSGGGGCVSPGLSTATGTTSVTGVIDHTHLDGLYSFDNASDSCHLSAATPAGERLQASVTATVLRARRAVAFETLIPVSQALVLLPVACPGDGDTLDGLNDNYFTPGFSFADQFGPSRWFTSARVAVPLSVLHRSAQVTIPLTDTPAGTPPESCGPAPGYVRCRTGGAWRGTLTLTRLA